MSVIAAEANISRATLYRYFEGRDEVLFGVMARDTRLYLERVYPRVASQPDLGSAILEFVWLTLEATRRAPTIARMFESEDSRETRGILMESSVELFEMVTEFFRPLFDEFADEVRHGTSLEDASEWILRVLLSLLTVKGPRRRARTSLDRFLTHFLLPVVIIEPGAD